MAGDIEQTSSRRDFLASSVRALGLLALGGIAGAAVGRAKGSTDLVWQIDPWRCRWCGKCATDCVLTPSAVKCLRDQPVCGYCEICTGYQAAERLEDDEAAENQICPTQAISRDLIEYPYYEYKVDEAKCIGCGKCCEGCTKFGNGSMYLQVKHDLCVNCNDCAIARVCPSDAFVRVPATRPYLLKGGAKNADGSIRREKWTKDKSKAGGRL